MSPFKCLCGNYILLEILIYALFFAFTLKINAAAFFQTPQHLL